MTLLNFEKILLLLYNWVRNEIEFTPPQRDYQYLVCVPCYSYHGQYFQKWHK
jgi:hypothetical protein